jgi:hypothetical protein
VDAEQVRERAERLRRAVVAIALIGATAGALACSKQREAGGQETLGASTFETPPAAHPSSSAPDVALSAEPAGPDAPELHVSADENGPRLYALAAPTYIYETPEQPRRLGYLRPGGSVRRAEKPVSVTRKCRDGWFRVAPQGYVCAGVETSFDAQHPLVVALSKPPARGEPLPYHYARTRSSRTFYYAKLPSLREQSALEGDDLLEHLEGSSRPNILAAVGGASAPPPFLASGKLLPKPLNQGKSLRVGGVHRGVASGRSSFAFVDVIDTPSRLFGLTTELDLVALDRVKLVTETRIHGGEVDDLPAALPLRTAPRLTRDDKKRVVTDGQKVFEAYTPIPLREGSVPGASEFLETRDDGLLPPYGLVYFKKRATFPGFLKDDVTKWIDVSIREQTLVAYVGRRAVYVTRVSTGAAGDADPETTSATIQGFYRIQSKHVTATMMGNRADVNEYELLDIPYVQYFHHSYALHAAFWHEHFGEPFSHGCVNLPPKDAAWLFEWTDVRVPADWHSAEGNGQGTLVFVHN